MNIQKARAARKRVPLPWRSGMESRVIEQLVWQWWMDKNSGQWPAFVKATARQASGEGKKQQIPHTATMRPVRNDKLGRPWAKYRVARLLGVSHTWVNKLVRRFEADPERMRRKMRAFAPATFDKLERAREETRRERECGLLRGPIRWRRVEVTLEGKKKKVVAATRAEIKRRALRQASFGSAQDRPVDFAQGQPCGLSGGQALREGRVEMRRDSASRAGAALPASGYTSRAATRAEKKMCRQAEPVRYSELPAWARGLLLPGDPGKTTPGSGMRTPRGQTPATAGKPRAVPFAFRRRR